jgi:hypothetical protein
VCREEKERHGVVSTQRWREKVRVFDLHRKTEKEKNTKKRNNRQERKEKRATESDGEEKEKRRETIK